MFAFSNTFYPEVGLVFGWGIFGSVWVSGNEVAFSPFAPRPISPQV